MSFAQKRAAMIVVLFVAAGLPLLGLFQNASTPTYDPQSTYDYYQNQVAVCTAADHRGCLGQVVEMVYEKSDDWGVSPVCPVTTYYAGGGSSSGADQPSSADGAFDSNSIPFGSTYSSLGGTLNVSRVGCGFQAPVFARDISQKVIYRSTGIYVTNYKNRNQFFDPQLIEEYSAAYDPTSEKAVSGPLRTTSMTYYFNLSPIPGNALNLSYYVLDLPTSIVVVGDSSSQTQYYPTGKTSANIVNGIETDYTYDSNGNIYQKYEWRDGVQMLVSTDTNYVDGIAQTITKPDGSVHSKVINPDGTIASETDALKNTTSYQYDLNLRLKQVTPPINSVTTISRPDELTTVTTHGSKQTTVTEDVLGRKLSTVSVDLGNSANSVVTSTIYDSDGRPTFTSLPGSGSASTYGVRIDSYDVLNRVLSKTQTSNNAVTTLTYTAPDTLTVKRPTGESSVRKFLNYGSYSENQLIEKDDNLVPNPTQPSQTVITKIARDVEGKVLEVNQGGVLRWYAYDSNQRLAQISEPERAATTLTYYGGSNLIKTKTIGTRAPITYTYDNLDRHYQILFSNANDNITYSYDPNGRVKSAATPLSTISMDYDANGNKLYDSLSIDGYTFLVNYGIDSLDRVGTVTYPDMSAFAGTAAGARNALTITYDGLNRAKTLTDLYHTVVSNVAYNANGMFNSIAYGNGLTSGLTLTSDQWPYQLSLSGGSANISLQYGYDLNGNVNAINDQINSAYNQSFNYDGLDRMMSASYPNGASVLPTGAQSSNLGGAITYSATGDILGYGEFSKITTALTYDPTTQLLSQTSGPITKNYKYDDGGQMISNSIYSFGYDPNFNMTSVSNASTNATVATYTYDANDLRVKKVLANGATTYYIYGGGQLAFEATVGKGAKEYFYLGSHLVGTRAVVSNVSTNYFYHFNPISSNIAQSDSSKVVTQERYNAFGSELVPNPNFSSKVDVRFAGHVSDDETNLVYMGGRYYDPSIGRFISPDPQGFDQANVQSFNKFIYANNNPLKFIDPNGHKDLEAYLNLKDTMANHKDQKPGFWDKFYSNKVVTFVGAYNVYNPIYDVNKEEKKWVMAHRVEAGIAKRDADKASSLAKSKFPGVSDWNTEVDAVRHFTWAAMLTRDLGEKTAREILSNHEKDPDNPAREKKMDLWNNEIGIEAVQLMGCYGWPTDEEIANTGVNAVKEHLMMVIDPVTISRYVLGPNEIKPQH